MPSTNSATINVAANTKLFLMATAHASYLQQVSVSFNSDGSNPLGTFQGTGEGEPMTIVGTTNQVLKVKTGTNTSLYAQFQYSTTGSQGPWQDPQVSPPLVFSLGTGSLTLVTSEDSTDGDDNDTTLVVIDL